MAADPKKPAADEKNETVAAELVGLHTLAPVPGSRRPRKRVGRGEGSGTGKTVERPDSEPLRGLSVDKVLGLSSPPAQPAAEAPAEEPPAEAEATEEVTA